MENEEVDFDIHVAFYQFRHRAHGCHWTARAWGWCFDPYQDDGLIDELLEDSFPPEFEVDWDRRYSPPQSFIIEQLKDLKFAAGLDTTSDQRHKLALHAFEKFIYDNALLKDN